jgi:hypothetical protein
MFEAKRSRNINMWVQLLVQLMMLMNVQCHSEIDQYIKVRRGAIEMDAK